VAEETNTPPKSTLTKTLSSLVMLLQMNAANATVHMDGSELSPHTHTFMQSQTSSPDERGWQAYRVSHSQQKNSRKNACVAAFERALSMPDQRSYKNTSRMIALPTSGETTTRSSHRLP
jgi:hypothetical protein